MPPECELLDRESVDGQTEQSLATIEAIIDDEDREIDDVRKVTVFSPARPISIG